MGCPPRESTASRDGRPEAGPSGWHHGAPRGVVVPPRESRASRPVTALSGTLAGSRREPEGTATRLRVDLSYDGSGFHGWSRQPGLRTVQQVVEEALGLALAPPARPR